MNTPNLHEKYLYCHQVLNLKPPKKRIIKRWQPTLTSEEKNLFDNEELLSSYQNIIANSCGSRQQVLFYDKISEVFFVD